MSINNDMGNDTIRLQMDILNKTSGNDINVEEVAKQAGKLDEGNFHKTKSLSDSSKSPKQHIINLGNNMKNAAIKAKNGIKTGLNDLNHKIGDFFANFKKELEDVSKEFKHDTGKLKNFFKAVGMALESLNKKLDNAEKMSDVKYAFKSFNGDVKTAYEHLTGKNNKRMEKGAENVIKAFGEGDLERAKDGAKELFKGAKGKAKEFIQEVKVMINEKEKQ